MGRAPCCERKGLKKGPWTPEEDEKLVDFIDKSDHGSWRSLPKLAGWAAIASQLPGRTDNGIKNLWNTHLKKRLLMMDIDPQTHEPSLASNRPPSAPRTPMASGSGADHFLRLWNSDIGETFRKVKSGGKASPSSSASTTKCCSISGTTTEIELKVEGSVKMDQSRKQSDERDCKSNRLCGEECDQTETDESSSNEMEDSSESTLQLLLDFPSNNDMSFLGNADCYSFYPSFSTDSLFQETKNGFV